MGQSPSRIFGYSQGLFDGLTCDSDNLDFQEYPEVIASNFDFQSFLTKQKAIYASILKSDGISITPNLIYEVLFQPNVFTEYQNVEDAFKNFIIPTLTNRPGPIKNDLSIIFEYIQAQLLIYENHYKKIMKPLSFSSFSEGFKFETSSRKFISAPQLPTISTLTSLSKYVSNLSLITPSMLPNSNNQKYNEFLDFFSSSSSFTPNDLYSALNISIHECFPSLLIHVATLSLLRVNSVKKKIKQFLKHSEFNDPRVEIIFHPDSQQCLGRFELDEKIKPSKKRSIMSVMPNSIFILSRSLNIFKIDLSKNLSGKENRITSYKVHSSSGSSHSFITHFSYQNVNSTEVSNIIFIGDIEEPTLFSEKNFPKKYRSYKIPKIKAPATSDGKYVYSISPKGDVWIYELNEKETKLIETIRLKKGSNDLLSPHTTSLIPSHWFDDASIICNGHVLEFISFECEKDGTFIHFARAFSLIDGKHIGDSKFGWPMPIFSLALDPIQRCYWVLTSQDSKFILNKIKYNGPIPPWTYGIPHETFDLNSFNKSSIQVEEIAVQSMEYLGMMTKPSFGAEVLDQFPTHMNYLRSIRLDQAYLIELGNSFLSFYFNTGDSKLTPERVYSAIRTILIIIGLDFHPNDSFITFFSILLNASQNTPINQFLFLFFLIHYESFFKFSFKTTHWILDQFINRGLSDVQLNLIISIIGQSSLFPYFLSPNQTYIFFANLARKGHPFCFFFIHQVFTYLSQHIDESVDYNDNELYCEQKYDSILRPHPIGRPLTLTMIDIMLDIVCGKDYSSPFIPLFMNFIILSHSLMDQPTFPVFLANLLMPLLESFDDKEQMLFAKIFELFMYCITYLIMIPINISHFSFFDDKPVVPTIKNPDINEIANINLPLLEILYKQFPNPFNKKLSKDEKQEESVLLQALLLHTGNASIIDHIKKIEQESEDKNDLPIENIYNNLKEKINISQLKPIIQVIYKVRMTTHQKMQHEKMKESSLITSSETVNSSKPNENTIFNSCSDFLNKNQEPIQFTNPICFTDILKTKIFYLLNLPPTNMPEMLSELSLFLQSTDSLTDVLDMVQKYKNSKKDANLAFEIVISLYQNSIIPVSFFLVLAQIIAISKDSIKAMNFIPKEIIPSFFCLLKSLIPNSSILALLGIHLFSLVQKGMINEAKEHLQQTFDELVSSPSIEKMSKKIQSNPKIRELAELECFSDDPILFQQHLILSFSYLCFLGKTLNLVINVPEIPNEISLSLPISYSLLSSNFTNVHQLSLDDLLMLMPYLSGKQFHDYSILLYESIVHNISNESTLKRVIENILEKIALQFCGSPTQFFLNFSTIPENGQFLNRKESQYQVAFELSTIIKKLHFTYQKDICKIINEIIQNILDSSDHFEENDIVHTLGILISFFIPTSKVFQNSLATESGKNYYIETFDIRKFDYYGFQLPLKTQSHLENLHSTPKSTSLLLFDFNTDLKSINIYSLLAKLFTFKNTPSILTLFAAEALKSILVDNDCLELLDKLKSVKLHNFQHNFISTSAFNFLDHLRSNILTINSYDPKNPLIELHKMFYANIEDKNYRLTQDRIITGESTQIFFSDSLPIDRPSQMTVFAKKGTPLIFGLLTHRHHQNDSINFIYSSLFHTISMPPYKPLDIPDGDQKLSFIFDPQRGLAACFSFRSRRPYIVEFPQTSTTFILVIGDHSSIAFNIQVLDPSIPPFPLNIKNQIQLCIHQSSFYPIEKITQKSQDQITSSDHPSSHQQTQRSSNSRNHQSNSERENIEEQNSNQHDIKIDQIDCESEIRVKVIKPINERPLKQNQLISEKDLIKNRIRDDFLVEAGSIGAYRLEDLIMIADSKLRVNVSRIPFERPVFYSNNDILGSLTSEKNSNETFIINPLTSVVNSISIPLGPEHSVSFNPSEYNGIPPTIAEVLLKNYAKHERQTVLIEFAMKVIGSNKVSFDYFGLSGEPLVKFAMALLISSETLVLSNLPEQRIPLDLDSKLSKLSIQTMEYSSTAMAFLNYICRSSQSKSEFFMLWVKILEKDFQDPLSHLARPHSNAIFTNGGIINKPGAIGYMILPMELGMRKLPRIYSKNKIVSENDVTYAYIQGETVTLSSENPFILIPVYSGTTANFSGTFVELALEWKYLTLIVSQISSDSEHSSSYYSSVKEKLWSLALQGIIVGSPFFYTFDDVIFQFLQRTVPLTIDDFTPSFVRTLNLFAMTSHTINHRFIEDFLFEQNLIFEDRKASALRPFFKIFNPIVPKSNHSFSNLSKGITRSSSSSNILALSSNSNLFDLIGLNKNHKKIKEIGSVCGGIKLLQEQFDDLKNDESSLLINEENIPPQQTPEFRSESYQFFILPTRTIPDVLTVNPQMKATLFEIKRLLLPPPTLSEFPFHLILSEWAEEYAKYPPAIIEIVSATTLHIRFIDFLPESFLILDPDHDFLNGGFSVSSDPCFKSSKEYKLESQIYPKTSDLYIRWSLGNNIMNHTFIVFSPSVEREKIRKLAFEHRHRFENDISLLTKIPQSLDRIILVSLDPNDLQNTNVPTAFSPENIALISHQNIINNMTPFGGNPNEKICTHIISLRSQLLMAFNWIMAHNPESTDSDGYKQFISLQLNSQKFISQIEKFSETSFTNIHIDRRVGLDVRFGNSKNLSKSMMSQFTSQYYNVSRFRSIDRPFHVEFAKENGIDVGGLSRDFASELIRDINEPNVGLCVQTHTANNYLIPSPAPGLENVDKIYKALGGFIAISIRSKLRQPFFFPPFFWDYLAGSTISVEDVFSIDRDFMRTIQGLKNAQENSSDNSFESMFGHSHNINDIRGNPINLGVKRLTKKNVAKFISDACQARLKELESTFSLIRKGFWENLGFSAPTFISGEMLEFLACGDKDVNLSKLRNVTQFTGMSKEDIDQFWAVLARMTPQQRRAFLQFSTGMMCLPPNQKEIFLHVDKLGGEVDGPKLPIASTCFFRIHIPPYSTVDKLFNVMIMAIENAGTFENS